jgi:hypothetical protein
MAADVGLAQADAPRPSLSVSRNAHPLAGLTALPEWLQLSAFVVVRSSSPSFTAQVRWFTEPRRTAVNAIKINWQCGGQGFESPQLHPSEQALSHRGKRLLVSVVEADSSVAPALSCRRTAGACRRWKG